MSVKGWTMSAIAVAVAAGTYFTLTTISPHEAERVSDNGLLDPDVIFAGSLEAPAAAPSAEAPPPAEPGDEAMLAMDEPADLEPPYDSGTDTAPADEADFEEPLPAATAEPTPAPTATATPAPTPAPTPAATPAPTPKPATPAPTPRATPAATPQPATPAPKPAATPRPTPAEIAPWWGPESASGLSLVYAGSAAYTRAVVLMFNGNFNDAAAAAKHLRVTDENGRTVNGKWEINARNPRMLLFPVSRTGTFTVSVDARLSDRDGRSLGKSVKGPVRVQ